MRASLIRHVDPWQDAARGSRYEGKLAADRLPRLSAAANLHAPIDVTISFHRRLEAEKRGAVEIELEVRGRFDMICQRCLEPLSIELAVRSSVWVVGDETAADAAARAADSPGDVIVSAPGERLDVACVVEDELLLALPFAPSHPSGTCTSQSVGEQYGSGHRIGHGVGEFANERLGSSGADTGHGATAAGSSGIGTAPSAGTASRSQSNGDNDDVRHDARRNPFAVLAAMRDNADEQDES